MSIMLTQDEIKQMHFAQWLANSGYVCNPHRRSERQWYRVEKNQNVYYTLTELFEHYKSGRSGVPVV